MLSLVKRLLGALTHLATLLLQTAGALLLPLPAELGARFLVRVGLMTHRDDRRADPRLTYLS